MSSARSCSRPSGARKPLIVGLTGSIGMGKTTAAAMLRRMGLPVHDADAAVHRLLGPGGRAVPRIAEAFPGTVADGVVDRRLLGAIVFDDKAALRRLEGILHPMVRAEARRFIHHHRRRRTPVVVLDIPLLFETAGDRLCDKVIVVSAPVFVQTRRVLRRKGMTRARLEHIRRQQLPDAQKRRRADFVVETGLSKYHTLRDLREIVKMLRTPGIRCRTGG